LVSPDATTDAEGASPQHAAQPAASKKGVDSAAAIE